MTGMGSGREFDLIREFVGNSRKTHAAIQVGSGDDCAILAVSPFAISTDMSVENVHFRRDWLQPQEIGYRAAMAALSDLAAVGAQPVAALVSFAFTQADAEGWATEVMKGVTEVVEAFDAVVTGGDVARTPDGAVIDMVVIGRADQPILRSTAKPGEEVWVTGTLGGAAAAVAAWLEGREPSRAVRERFARPVARVKEGMQLRGVASAMIDLSDGVAGDARHLAAASGCRIIIDAALLPVHAGATVAHALAGGEDYELCFTAPRGARIDLDIEVTKIGEVVAGEGIEIRNGRDGGGYDHFGGMTR
jgi:thiamine-monophosphate kinase